MYRNFSRSRTDCLIIKVVKLLKRRKKTRVRKKNMGFKKLIILFLLIFIIIQLLTKVIVPGAVTVSRYMYSVARGYYLNTKKFYFNSDKLSDSLNPAHFKADNWSGVDPGAKEGCKDPELILMCRPT